MRAKRWDIDYHHFKIPSTVKVHFKLVVESINPNAVP